MFGRHKRERSRREVQARRMALISAPLMGLLIGLFMRSIASVRPTAEPTNSLVFGDISHWPKWVTEGWLPLDLALMTLAFWCVMTLMLVGQDRIIYPAPKLYNQLGGFVVGFGCFGSAMGTMVGGWYRGVEMFFMGMLAGAGLMVFAGCAIGLAIGTAKLGTIISAKLQNREPHATGTWDARWAKLGERLRSARRRISQQNWIKPFRAAGRWISAADVSDQVDDPPTTTQSDAEASASATR